MPHTTSRDYARAANCTCRSAACKDVDALKTRIAPPPGLFYSPTTSFSSCSEIGSIQAGDDRNYSGVWHHNSQSQYSLATVTMSAEGEYDENVDDGGMAAPGAPTPLTALEVLQLPRYCSIPLANSWMRELVVLQSEIFN